MHGYLCIDCIYTIWTKYWTPPVIKIVFFSGLGALVKLNLTASTHQDILLLCLSPCEDSLGKASDVLAWLCGPVSQMRSIQSWLVSMLRKNLRSGLSSPLGGTRTETVSLSSIFRVWPHKCYCGMKLGMHNRILQSLPGRVEDVTAEDQTPY